MAGEKKWSLPTPLGNSRDLKSQDTKQVYLAGLQKKVKIKYDEAQERLEKSKSLDSLNSFLDDVNVEKNHTVNPRSIPKIELPDDDYPFYITKSSSVGNISDMWDDRFSAEIETCFTKDFRATNCNSPLPHVATDEESSYEFVSVPTESLGDGKNVTDKENIINNSIKEEKNDELSTENTKLSLRGKIKLKLAKAKERRHSKKLSLLNKIDSSDEIDKVILSNSTAEKPPPTPTSIKQRKKNKIGTVTVGLKEATGYERDPEGKNKIYPLHCRLKLGAEKYKSKPIKEKAGKYSWMELSSLSLYDDYSLEISLWEKDHLIGRANIDTSNLEKDQTHEMKLSLNESPNVELLVLITVSGMISTTETMHSFRDSTEEWNSKNCEDVGILMVAVFGAKGLIGQDCFCVLELVNQRVQTQTEYKTNDPVWFKRFDFVARDITSILEVTVHDEKRADVIGKISIPLLNINNGQRQWYALKDVRQREAAKGVYPRICLEMNVYWNLLRASIRVITPKEKIQIKPEQSLDRHILARNLHRIRAVITWVLKALVVIKTCFEWESRRDNLIALALWLTFCWNFHGWMVPLLLILPFLWYRQEYQYFYNKLFPKRNDDNDWNDDDLIEPHATASNTSNRSRSSENNDKEEKSLRQRFHSLQEMVLIIQKNMGVVASYGESIKNLYNFTVPYLSWLAIFFITIISFVLYLVPAKYLFMGWGIHKFMRKILRPNRIPNNEVLDLLSRVPDDETLLNCQLLNLDAVASEEDFFEENK